MAQYSGPLPPRWHTGCRRPSRHPGGSQRCRDGRAHRDAGTPGRCARGGSADPPVSVDRAQEIRLDAQRQAAELVAKARDDAKTVRAQSEADELREAGADEDDMRRQMEAEIAQLRQRADERLVHDVEIVTAQAREWLDNLVRSATAENKR